MDWFINTWRAMTADGKGGVVATLVVFVSALATVGVNPGINQSALGAMLNIAGPSVVKVIDDLEGMEVLRRERMGDRRNYALVLIEKGVDALQKYQRLVKTFEVEIATALTDAERQQLLRLLSRIAPTESWGSSERSQA